MNFNKFFIVVVFIIFKLVLVLFFFSMFVVNMVKKKLLLVVRMFLWVGNFFLFIFKFMLYNSFVCFCVFSFFKVLFLLFVILRKVNLFLFF